MEEHVQIATDGLFEAHAAFLKARATFKKCQAALMIKLGTDATIEECNKLIDANFEEFVKRPRIRKATVCEFHAAGVFTQNVPSWTLNDILDSENDEVFKRRRVGCA